MGREVRMVPPTWEHPKDERGRFIPLSDDFCRRVSDHYRERAMWELGYSRDWSADGVAFKPKDADDTDMTFEQWCGGKPPKAEEHMPDWAPQVRTHYQMYEDTSEGTPISPVMASPEELAHWLADNKASSFGDMTANYESWLATIRAGSAIGMVIANGAMKSGVEFEGERTA